MTRLAGRVAKRLSRDDLDASYLYRFLGLLWTILRGVGTANVRSGRPTD